EAHEMIALAATGNGFDYVGFVEGGDIPSERVDVVVTDGFTGNIALKTGEGTARLVGELLREAFRHSPLSRLGALFALTSLRRLQKRIDPRRVNGGVFLGLNGTVIKSHGAADATGVSAAIKLAFQLSQSGFTDRLAARVASGAPPSKDDVTEGTQSERET
ncbi:MAG: phosphate acyltransferase, partial [Alphaproteobacteria bacterium HGW-Alphaproteobacteria-2]